MSSPATVAIIGAPVACKEGIKDSWRDIADWATGQLRARFGESVVVIYYDLFDPACPPIPPEAQLPLVLINCEILSNGGKISVPSIRKHLEALGIQVVRSS